MNKMAKKVSCLQFLYTFYNKSNLYKLEMKLFRNVFSKNMI